MVPVIIRSNKKAEVYLEKVFDEDHKYEVRFEPYFDHVEGFYDWLGREKFGTLKEATRFYVSKVKEEKKKQKDANYDDVEQSKLIVPNFGDAHERWIEMQNEMHFDRYYCE